MRTSSLQSLSSTVWCSLLKNWPLPTFCSPSHVSTPAHTRILYKAFHTGVAYFEKLGKAEYEQWAAGYYARLANAERPSAVTIATPLPGVGDDSSSPSISVNSSAPDTPAVGLPSANNNPLGGSSQTAEEPAVTRAPLQNITPAVLNFSISRMDGQMVGKPIKPRKKRCDAGSSKK